MSSDSKAVFLSYASQDAAAARRICDALRAAGVQVWFDQRELRGGDAWDHAIRQRIKSCALSLLSAEERVANGEHAKLRAAELPRPGEDTAMSPGVPRQEVRFARVADGAHRICDYRQRLSPG